MYGSDVILSSVHNGQVVAIISCGEGEVRYKYTHTHTHPYIHTYMHVFNNALETSKLPQHYALIKLCMCVCACVCMYYNQPAKFEAGSVVKPIDSIALFRS